MTYHDNNNIENEEKQLLDHIKKLPDEIINNIYDYLNGYPKLLYHKKFEWYDKISNSNIYGNTRFPLCYSEIDHSLKKILENITDKQFIQFYENTMSKHLPYFLENICKELKQTEFMYLYEITNVLFSLQIVNINMSPVVKEILKIITNRFKQMSYMMDGLQISNCIFGLQQMTAESKEIRELLKIIKIHLEKTSYLLNENQYKNALFGLQKMSHNITEVKDLYNALTVKLEESNQKLQQQGINRETYYQTSKVYQLVDYDEENRVKLKMCVIYNVINSSFATFTYRKIFDFVRKESDIIIVIPNDIYYKETIINTILEYIQHKIEIYTNFSNKMKYDLIKIEERNNNYNKIPKIDDVILLCKSILYLYNKLIK